MDTLAASQRLKDAGFEQKQADAIVNVIDQRNDELATKADIIRLDDKINRLEKIMFYGFGIMIGFMGAGFFYVLHRIDYITDVLIKTSG